MKMTAITRLVGDVTIVDLSGRIVLGEGPLNSEISFAIWQAKGRRRSC